MKTHFFKLQILFIVALSYYNPIYSQDKFEVSVGLGCPELINAHIKYGQNLQVGLCGGFAPGEFYGNSYTDWSIAAEISYHFIGKSKYVEQPPWYVLGGLGYYHLPLLGDYEAYDIGLYPRIGRYFNFSKKIGINLDGGIFLPLSKSPDYQSFDFKVLLSGDISVFIRL